MPGALDGIKILEFTEIIAGPFGGMLLADMGADVIKVEPPWGDPWRHAFPIEPGESKTFMSLNRGKRSLPLDLTKQEGRDVVYRLISDMDAVIINYRPDVPYNLGIDYETLSAINPASHLLREHRLRAQRAPQPTAGIRHHCAGDDRHTGIRGQDK